MYSVKYVLIAVCSGDSHNQIRIAGTKSWLAYLSVSCTEMLGPTNSID